MIVESSQNPSEKDQFDIGKLLDERLRIDKLIEEQYKREISIMFTDIVGSMEYFEQYGDLAGRAMIQQHNNLLFPLIERFNGQVIKTIGDSIMAKFYKADDAIEASIAMQNTLQNHNLTSREGIGQILIRIGMHSGQAVEDEKDCYGGAINTAARVEAMAEGNEIFVTRELVNGVKDEVKKKCVPVSKIKLKEMAEEIEIFAVNWMNLDTQEFINSLSISTSERIKDKSSRKHHLREVVKEKRGVSILEPFHLPPPRQSIPPSYKGNPYLNRVMIVDPDDFYGRDSIVQKLFAKIDITRPQSVSIVGDRKIGKSSLLNYLINPKTREEHLINPDRLIFIYIDFQQFRGNTIEDFFLTVFNGIIREFSGNIVINLDADYRGFLQLIEEFEKNNLSLIFLFDEFEVITKNPHFGHDFFSFFRSIANNYPVAYFTTSGRKLQDLCHTKEISDSPFFNIFTNVILEPFDEQEARLLIREPSARRGIPLESYSDSIISMAGYLPFYLQVACSSYFDIIKESRDMLKQDIHREAEKVFWEEAQVHFDYLLENLDEVELGVLKTIATNRRISTKYEHTLQGLIKRGIVAAREDRYALFSYLLRNCILGRYNLKSIGFWKRIF